MEIAADGYTTTKPTTTVKKEKLKKLTVEEYLDFVHDRTIDRTADQLRQILGMHGWAKSQAQKKVLINMVTTMELMDLRRSTLMDGVVSGDAEITLEEAINDFKNLEWEECHVTSLLTQRAVAPAAAEGRTVSVKRTKTLGKKKAAEVAVDDSAISGGTTVPAKRKAPKTFVKKAVDDSGASAGTNVAAGGTTVTGKRKRSKKATEVPVDGSAASGGTTAAAGSTPQGLGGDDYSAFPAVLLLMRNVTGVLGSPSFQ